MTTKDEEFVTFPTHGFEATLAAVSRIREALHLAAERDAHAMLERMLGPPIHADGRRAVVPEQLWETEPDLDAEVARADEIFKSV